MRTNLRNLMISQESTAEEVVEELVGSDSMEADMLDAEVARGEVDRAAEDVAELEEAAEGLEAIAASLESAMADGGVDEQTARFMTIGVESYTHRLGLDVTTVVPALESFGGASGKASATTISVEGIQDTIKKIWQAIKQAVTKAMEAVSDFFAKIFQSVDKVVARAKALEKDVAELGDKKAESKVSVPEALSVGGSADAAAVKKGLAGVKSVGGHIFGDYLAKAADFYARAAKNNSDSALLHAEEATAIESAKGAVSSIMSDGAQVLLKTSSVEMSGGYVFTSVASGDSEGEGKGVSIPALQKKSGAQKSGEIDALSAADMKAILADVEDIAKLVNEKKGAFEKLQAARKDAVAKSDKLASEGEKGKLGKAWDMGKVRASLGLVNRDMTRPVSQFAGHGFSTMRAALSLVEKSVKAYK